MSAYVLRTEGLIMRFGGLVAVNDFSIEVERGRIVGLIGPNGAGKTTCFNMMTGFYKPTEGKIFFEDKEITALPPHMVCRSGIARTFQNIRLFGTQSVLANVMVACNVWQKSSWMAAALGLPSYSREHKLIEETSLKLLDSVGLTSLAYEQSNSLPYGAQRRLEIARALATKPKFLLLDEPAAGMNPQESDDLNHFIRNIRNDFSLTVLLIEHDMKVVMEICEHIWVLDYGQIIAKGSPHEIQNNPKVIEAYLGEEYVQYA